MKNKAMALIGGVVIIGVMGVAQFLSTRPATSPATSTTASTTEQNGSTQTTAVAPAIGVDTTPKYPSTLPQAYGDTITSWNFQSAYTNNPELVAKTQAEIKRLSDLLSTATSSAMILSVGIANQYDLLGDGKKEYEYLDRAIRGNPENGLPWHNLGVLMERLGAFKTARVAYEESTFVQPELKFYHYAYIEFLTSRTKDDTAHIEKAFAFAEKNIGTTPYLIELRTEWQKP
ncbi:MAG: tetratricopeptide repeat protein [Candidatus Paceibacterota bacterium]|jgi:Flp pilus assembly protein TadD